ncbi:GL12483 [Drosophila persimilis]|uniref:GL12483 n=1 Tax=Drosophila persimilis TaxID=7234 RepID=B4GL10_DROPE|nr:uncharacterized protein LOC6594342 [Drosophila persimilis]EDW38234.1 GL12483 [Drosophila persimilis]
MGHIELDYRAIPKLHGCKNYWQWRILMRTYLETNDLWKHNDLKDTAITKFLILASVEADLIEPAYDNQSCKYIFDDLESRFSAYT